MNKKVFYVVALLFFVCACVLNVEAKDDEKKKKANQNIEKTFRVNKNDKGFKEVKKIEKIEKVEKDTDLKKESIPVNVKNEFDEEIKVKLDTNREYPIAAHESITLGKRLPGRYTLTIYNEKGEFVDNLTKSIDKNNKFVLNKDTVSNSGKIVGLSTGKKIAIGAGALGAIALGSAILNMAQNQEETAEYIPPPPALLPQPQVVINPLQAPQAVSQETNYDNAFASGGKAFKFLNKNYDEVTLIVEGTDGNSIGSNWEIPKAKALQKPQPLIINGEKITINSNQKVKAVLPDGRELVRSAFELKGDPLDGSYVWVLE